MLNENVKSNTVQENKIPFILICGLKTDACASVKTCQIRYFDIISAYIHNILWQIHHSKSFYSYNRLYWLHLV